MRLLAIDTPAAECEADALVVGLHADGIQGPVLAALDAALGGIVTRLWERQEITGKMAELTRLIEPSGVRADQLIVVGLGQRDTMGQGPAMRAAGAAAKQLAAKARKKVAFFFEEDWDDEWIEAGICGAMAACQGQDLYRAEKKLRPFEELCWQGASSALLANAEIVGQCINLTRRLVNEAPSTMNPARFADEAAEVAEESGLDVEVWDESRLAEERCQSLLAVARGSAHAPRLVILNYRGGTPQQAPIALVGKGVTFDSGGLSLKPTDGMKTMKCDMGGAATVLGAMAAIARLRIPANVVGYAGLVENMVSGDSYKLGDVLTARNGTTIEVLNTDAEGRLVLADALSVAVDQGATRIIDLATLTGACLVALGTDVAGVMTNDQQWCDQLSAAARHCGEPTWQLPMFEEFGEQILSDVADVKNVGEARWGGAITAAKFLEHFVETRPWIHIDIAGPSFAEKPKAWLDAGGTGAMVRTLVELIRRQA